MLFLWFMVLFAFFSLSLATIYQIRYNLAYITPISVQYLFQTAEIQDSGLQL